MTVDPMAIYRAILDASEPQIANSEPGRHLRSVLADTGMAKLRELLQLIAANAANGIAFEIEEANGVAA